MKRHRFFAWMTVICFLLTVPVLKAIDEFMEMPVDR